MTKEAVVLVADAHINSTMGLVAESARYDNGALYIPSTAQRWLGQTFLKCRDTVKELTKGYYVNLILDGDMVDIDAKGRSNQIITENQAVAVDMAENILEPWVEIANVVFVVRGTEAHTGQSAWAEEDLGARLHALKDPETDAWSWWQVIAEFGDKKFDIAHHYSMGALPWTYANAANRLAAQTIFEYQDWGEMPPDFVIRSHNHRFADSGLNYPTRAFFLPCWQWGTAYVSRIGKYNARPHIGALVFLLEGGECIIRDLRYRPMRRSIWRTSQAI